MKPPPSSLHLLNTLAGLVAAGAIVAGVEMTRRPSQSDSPAAARHAPLPSSQTKMKVESRRTVPSIVRPAVLNEREAVRVAFLHLKTHGFSDADRYRCGILFRRWAELDFTAAFECADRQASGIWREEMLGWLALVVARLSPAEAAVIVDRDMQPGVVRAETAISILHQWARTDLAQAAAWADSFPQGPLRDRALDEVAGFLSTVPPSQSPN
ncbi:MAG: hypothetical protein K0R17_597 [Rariglobus sp.]|jgi:hypothetical protein|nr:hypothetical protein [Rariglobus sp.]